MPDEELMREYVKLQKEEKRRRSSEAMGRLLGAAGKMLPKGIRHPDSLCTNLHLYVPGRRGKTKLR